MYSFSLDDINSTVIVSFASVLVLAAVAISASVSREQYERIGNSKWLTWIPGTTPMRYELQKYAQMGYDQVNKAKGKPFLLKFFGYDYVMLPPKYVEDLRRGRPEQTSFEKSFSDALNIGATVGDLYGVGIMERVTVKHLAPSELKQRVTRLAQETDYAFSLSLGLAQQDWKRVKAASVLGMAVHRLANLIFVGEGMSRDEKYIQDSLRFSGSLLPAGVWTNFIDFGPFRDAVARWTTFFHRSDLNRCLKTLIPVIEERMRQKDVGEKNDHDDVIQWTIDAAVNTGSPREAESRRIAENVLHLLFAANSAPGAVATQAVYQMLMQPEYFEPLTSEIRQAVEEEGGWTSRAIERMALLDSFVRETVRLYPPGSIACTRTVQHSDFELHDGTPMPIGSRFAFPVLAIQTDPANYPSPNQFDGYRFVDGQPDGSFKTKIASTTLTPTYLALGYGKHGCPGRYFGILKAKLVLAKLLLNFEIKWPTAMGARPANVSIEGMVPPHQTQEILIRRKTSAGPA